VKKICTPWLYTDSSSLRRSGNTGFLSCRVLTNVLISASPLFALSFNVDLGTSNIFEARVNPTSLFLTAVISLNIFSLSHDLRYFGPICNAEVNDTIKRMSGIYAPHIVPGRYKDHFWVVILGPWLKESRLTAASEQWPPLSTNATWNLEYLYGRNRFL
jgi:hypothetical protein